ncbi:hypothetical protein JVU11DRAFT_4647 [Chiua virens]|nr:hypothetical protein JVU11DRAFT_4647 [Chiua virens]
MILLAAGSNAKGQLGIGCHDDAHTFTPCQFAGHKPNQLPDPTSRVAHIACGANHTVLLLEHFDGSTSLWGTGDGTRGQLGLGYDGPLAGKSEPKSLADTNLDVTRIWTIFRELRLYRVELPGSKYTYKAIAAAWETTYVVLSRPDSSDVLLSMGSNDFGAVGVGEDDGSRRAASHRPGEPWPVDFGHIFPDDCGLARTVHVRSIHAGARHVVAQLECVVASSDESPSHSQTALVGWGASRHGQLGQQSDGVRFVARPTRLPIHIHDDPVVSCALGNQHTVVLHASGRISALGSNKQGQIPSLGSQVRICALGCTWNGTYMRTTEGEQDVLLSTGNNAQGQLGRGDTVESISTVDAVVSLPVHRAISSFVCGSEHVLVVMDGASQEGKSVLGWGWNEHGNMGLGSLGNITVPAQLWPRREVEAHDRYPQKVVNIWAGCATSWLLVE